MQTLVIRIVAGPGIGLQAALRSGQKLTVGRSAWADLRCAADLNLQDLHFVVESQANEWTVATLRPEYPLSRNGAELERGGVRHGDLLAAGNSQFRILDGSRAGEFRSQPAPSENSASAIAAAANEPASAAIDVVALLAELAIELPGGPETGSLSVTATAERLAAAGQPTQACQLIAAAIGATRAVAWMHTACDDPPGTLPVELTALVTAWQEEPTESRRREAEAFASSRRLKRPAGWIAQTIFWSGGSISAPELPEVIPAPYLFTRAVSAGLTLRTVELGGPPAAAWKTLLTQGQQALSDAGIEP